MHQKSTFAFVYLTACAVAPMAWAQEARPDVQDEAATVGEVVVTAQRREERLIDVPMAVSAVSGETLAASGVSNTRDLTQIVPGLVLQSSGFLTQPTIRGITSTGTAAGDFSNVAIYVDGAYVASPTVALFDLRNIERIEVLKGPQGTLFGRNATGGAIRVITRDPSTEPSIEIDARLGFNFGQQEINTYATTGIGDDFAVDLAWYYYTDDGFVENVSPGWTGGDLAVSNKYAIRSKAVYRPIDALKVMVALDYSRSDGSTDLTSDVLLGNNSFNTRPGVVTTTRPYQSSVSTPTYSKIENFGAVGSLEYTWGDATITAISAYRDSKLERQVDNDKTNLEISGNRREINERNSSQEIQIAGPYGEHWYYVVGANYFQSQSCGCNDMSFANSYPPTNITNLSSYTVDGRAMSGFGEFTFVPSEHWEFIGGVRFDHEEKDFAIIRTIPTLASNSDSDSWDSVSYRATAKFSPSVNTSFYGTVSTGFKSGQYGNTITPITKVNPETILAFEVGAKSQLSRAISVMASAFHYKYSDIQVLSRDIFNFQNILQNAAEAEISGIDAEARAQLGAGLSVSLGLAWLPRAEYTSFPSAVVNVRRTEGLGNVSSIVDLSGTRVLRSPEYTVNLGANYERELAGGTATLSGNYYYNDGFYFNVGLGPEQPAYSVVNLRAAWTIPTERYTVYLWGTNVTGTEYFAGSTSSTAGDTIYWARPREVGIGITARF